MCAIRSVYPTQTGVNRSKRLGCASGRATNVAGGGATACVGTPRNGLTQGRITFGASGLREAASRLPPRRTMFRRPAAETHRHTTGASARRPMVPQAMRHAAKPAVRPAAPDRTANGLSADRGRASRRRRTRVVQGVAGDPRDVRANPQQGGSAAFWPLTQLHQTPKNLNLENASTLLERMQRRHEGRGKRDTGDALDRGMTAARVFGPAPTILAVCMRRLN